MTPGFRWERWRVRIVRSLRARLGLARNTYVHDRLAEYQRYWEDGARLAEAQFVTIAEGIWEARRDGRAIRLALDVAPCDTAATLERAGDKPFCYQLARDVGIPVPDHVVVDVDDLSPARRFFDLTKAPFVVKPARGTSSGMGVTTRITTWPSLRRAIALASLLDNRVLVERMIVGESVRLLYLGGQLIHAARRRGVRVVGDGLRTIADLLDQQNLSRLSRDPNVAFTLRGSGRALTDTPADGESVLVRGLPVGVHSTRELRTVYDETVTDQIGPALAVEVGAVISALGTEFAGIDLICNDLARRLAESGGTFLEINTTPGLHHHYISPADFGEFPVARRVLEHLFSSPHAGRSDR